MAIPPLPMGAPNAPAGNKNSSVLVGSNKNHSPPLAANVIVTGGMAVLSLTGSSRKLISAAALKFLALPNNNIASVVSPLFPTANGGMIPSTTNLNSYSANMPVPPLPTYVPGPKIVETVTAGLSSPPSSNTIYIYMYRCVGLYTTTSH